MAAILNLSKEFVQRKDKRVYKIEATKDVEGIFKFKLISSKSGRFFLIYVNEVGEQHGIYHADCYLL